MKKRVFRLLCLSLAMVLLFAGCAFGKTGGEDSEPNEPTSYEGTGVVLEKKDAAVAGAYTLGEPMAQEAIPSVSLQNGLLLCRYFQGSTTRVSVVDVRTGKELAALPEIRGSVACGWIKDGFYVFDGSEVALYSVDGKEKSRSPMEGQTLWFLLSDDGRFALTAAKDGAGYVFDLKKQKTVSLSQPQYITTCHGYSKGVFLAENANGEALRIKTDGTVLPIEKRLSAHLVGPWYAETTKDGLVLTTPESPTPHILYGDVDSEYAHTAGGDYLLTELNDGTLKLYNVRTAACTDPLPLPELIQAAMDDSGLTALYCRDKNDEVTLYIIDAGKQAYPHSLTASDSYKYAEPYEQFFAPTEAENDRAAELISEIYETYHIRVFFKVNPEEDDVLLFHAFSPYQREQVHHLTLLRDYCRLFPADIFREITPKGEECWFLFCEEIMDEAHNPDDVAGLTFTLGANPVVAVETDWEDTDFMAFLAHEFTHLLDQGVSVTLHGEWDAISGDNKYFGSYTYPYEADQYTFGREDKDALFIDAYARTFEEEDIARTGEKLYTSYAAGKPDDVFSAPVIRRKAEKLTEMFRKTYPSLKSFPQGEFFMEKVF